MQRYVGILGIALILGLAFLLSIDRKAIDKKLVFWGIFLQALFVILILGIPAVEFEGPFRFLFDAATNAFNALLSFTDKGAEFVFGSWVDPSKPHGFIFAIKVLPTVIFFSSLMAVAYHLGIMQKIVKAIAVVMQKFMGTSGAESLAAAAEIFVGQTESPLMIKPFMPTLTRSELFSIMVGGMATVAGGVMAAYVGLLRDRIPDIAGHLLTASVISAPAALMIAKIMLPEKDRPLTLGKTQIQTDKIDANVIEAAARGASEGLSLALNIAAMLIAFIALVAFFNAGLARVGTWIGFENWGAGLVPAVIVQKSGVVLSFEVIMGWLFSPLAWALGVPWGEASTIGALLGEKIILNEFVAYAHLSEISSTLSDRAVLIASYALCGFANFSSIAIQIGGTGGLAPTRRSEIAQMGIRALVGGALSTMMAAAMAGLFI